MSNATKRTDNFVEPARDPAKQTLSHVVVGQLVWVDTKWEHRSTGVPTNSRLTEITHIDKKGRLFYCKPEPELISNYRYGFDPLTGKAAYFGYKPDTIRYATMEEIEAEWARIAAETAAKEDEHQKTVAKARVQHAAEDLLQAATASYWALSVNPDEHQHTLGILAAALKKAGHTIESTP